MYICEKCGKEVFAKYGSGRFCCRACANSRLRSAETKEKISKSVSQNYLKRNIIKSSPKSPVIRKQILRGQQLAEEINLKNSPYKEYNTAFIRKQVGDREAYLLCLYEGNKLIKSELVLCYRYLLACSLNRKLDKDEIVHHKDGNCLNNDISNLVILTRSDHSKEHMKNNHKLANHVKQNGPWNKGLKECYSEESIQKMRDSAIKRHKK